MSASARPLIGVTAFQETVSWSIDDPQPTKGSGSVAVLPTTYLEAVEAVGGVPVILPASLASASTVDRLDGLLLTGGPDVDPASYGASVHPMTGQPRRDRDDAELAVYRAARARGVPVLAVCRGLQVMAVAHGGTLHQHLPDVVTGTLHRGETGEFVDHPASFAPGSLIASVLGDGHVVNSAHHQAVADAGDLVVTGTADDGSIEVCEDPTSAFCLGVQWHPERADRLTPDRPLWEAFVRACLVTTAAR